MKKLLLVLVLLLTGCATDVPSGYVGVKVNNLGSDKGVDSVELGTGRYYLGWNENLYIFPTFSQTQVWTRDENEGSPNDDSFTFQADGGLSVNADIGITYSIDPKKVSIIFQKYRKGIEEITHTFLRSAVRDAVSRSASIRSIETIYGAGKSDLIKEVEDTVRAETESIGINIEHIYFIGEMRLPPSIITSINAKAAASQLTAQREQEIQQSKAEATKLVTESQGKADAQLAIAKANALAINLEGEALRNNPNVLELRKLERWDGHLPQIVGSSTPFINLSK
jgi:regulator of protease activity HflC (stomatin/prohibitin superfamily)